MNKLAIAFSTKDRPELTRRSIEPLLQPDKFDLWWVDGSKTPEGERLPQMYNFKRMRSNLRGGADAAIVYGLTTLLNAEENYAHVGLCENDVLLHPDWLGSTMALFGRGRADGLAVGAVSARCFEDRILCQRDGYSVNHNSGAGFVIFTREAAAHVLQECRNAWSVDNRRVFMQLSGLDIGKWWAFRGLAQHLTYDWNFEVILARHGLASLALVPNMVEMIGQVPPLHEQGLKYADQPVELLRNDVAFDLFVDRTRWVREGKRLIAGGEHGRYQADNGLWTIFPHQIEAMGGEFEGTWRLKWTQGFGPFTWESSLVQQTTAPHAALTVPVSGPCSILVGGGEKGGKIKVDDTASGYSVDPTLEPEGFETKILQLVVPASVSYRDIKITALSPGLRFYGLQTQEPQPWFPEIQFDHSKLPPVT